MRSEADAILVGKNTVNIDNPKLNCRIEGLKRFSPIRIILSKKLDLDINSNIFKYCKINRTFIFTVKNEKKTTSNYTVQTSSFKNISKSKMHITLLKNKIKILRSFEHQIKKNGRYFISFINVDDYQTAKNLCNEIKLNKLDCLIKTS